MLLDCLLRRDGAGLQSMLAFCWRLRRTMTWRHAPKPRRSGRDAADRSRLGDSVQWRWPRWSDRPQAAWPAVPTDRRTWRSACHENRFFIANRFVSYLSEKHAILLNITIMPMLAKNPRVRASGDNHAGRARQLEIQPRFLNADDQCYNAWKRPDAQAWRIMSTGPQGRAYSVCTVSFGVSS